MKKIAFALILILGACANETPVVEQDDALAATLPGDTELAEALGLAADQVREASCALNAEEGTEYHCSFEYRCEGSDWNEAETMIAADGDRYTQIDGLPACAPVPLNNKSSAEAL